MKVITLPVNSGPHYGRKALVGQFVKEETDGYGIVISRVDQSWRVNYDRSKKYPHSSIRQNTRQERLRERFRRQYVAKWGFEP